MKIGITIDRLINLLVIITLFAMMVAPQNSHSRTLKTAYPPRYLFAQGTFLLASCLILNWGTRERTICCY